MRYSFEVEYVDNGCIITESKGYIQVVESMDKNVINQRIGEIFTETDTSDSEYITEQELFKKDVGGFRIDFTITPIEKRIIS